MYLICSATQRAVKRYRAFTLAEVVVAIAIVALVLGGMTVAYTQTTRRAQWTGYSLAAQALAVQQLEQARAAVWDSSIGKNEITNLNLSGFAYASGVWTGYTWTNLDIPISGTNVVRATNYVKLKLLYINGVTNPPVQLQMLRVDTVWPFRWGATQRYFTNTVSSYYAPDNRDANSL
jgi:prepilin-type N-terminal cleavage/methylation domain-containing protein